MQKVVGIVAFVVGVLMFVFGDSLAQAFSRQSQQLYLDSPNDQVMWRYVGGGGLCVLGIVAVFAKKK